MVIINTQLHEDIPDFLHPFLDEATATTVTKTKKGKVLIPPSLVSFKNIPFDIPASLALTLKRPFNERFLVMENSCYLRDLAPTFACANCGNKFWNEDSELTDTTLITSNQVYKAKGMCRS